MKIWYFHIFHSERNFTQFRWLLKAIWPGRGMSSRWLSYVLRRLAVFVLERYRSDQGAWRISLKFWGFPLECVYSLPLNILTFWVVQGLASWISIARLDLVYQVVYYGNWKSSECIHPHLTSSLLLAILCSWMCVWRGFLSFREESPVFTCNIPSCGPSWWY